MNKPADGEKLQEEGSVTVALHFILISFSVLTLGEGYHCVPLIMAKKEWGMRHGNTYAAFSVTLNNSGPASSFKLLESFSLTGLNVRLARLGPLESAGPCLPNLGLIVNWVNSHL